MRRQGTAIGSVPYKNRLFKAVADWCVIAANPTTYHEFSVIIKVVSDLRDTATITIFQFHDAPHN